MKRKNILIIVIIMLMILLTITICYIINQNKTAYNAESNEREINVAIGKIKLKIADIEIENNNKIKTTTLQDIVDKLIDDEEIEYVTTKNDVASIDKIVVVGNDSIYTKLKEYPYEFEIDSLLRVASTDDEAEEITEVTRQEFEDLKTKVNGLSTSLNNLKDELKINMVSPKELVNAGLTETNTNTRDAGTYKASASTWVKTDSSDLNKYLTYTENTGWTVKESGWYYIRGWYKHRYTSAAGATYYTITIDETTVAYAQNYITKDDKYTGFGNVGATVYLKEGNVIDGKAIFGSVGIYSLASFHIYRLFEVE